MQFQLITYSRFTINKIRYGRSRSIFISYLARYLMRILMRFIKIINEVIKRWKLEMFAAMKRLNVISKNHDVYQYTRDNSSREKVARCRWPETLRKIHKIVATTISNWHFMHGDNVLNRRAADVRI